MKLKVNNNTLELPAFFPDATHGHIRGCEFGDLDTTNTKGLVVNTYHLLNSEKITEIKKPVLKQIQNEALLTKIIYSATK